MITNVHARLAADKLIFFDATSICKVEEKKGTRKSVQDVERPETDSVNYFFDFFAIVAVCQSIG
jgi:hypothetical protein